MTTISSTTLLPEQTPASPTGKSVCGSCASPSNSGRDQPHDNTHIKNVYFKGHHLNEELVVVQPPAVGAHGHGDLSAAERRQLAVLGAAPQLRTGAGPCCGADQTSQRQMQTGLT
ncbi:jg25926 [Pararge aegeria aegeria]|uniref:Jg25926 protein n=1 Tax=Pararge aegeria aegeria TaxID=348720 RepID=A0A8S4QQI4_9NEOP|nr:jg25926 [Pararge aegeria aegeria]